MFDRRWVKAVSKRACKETLDGLCENDLIDAPQADLERGLRAIFEKVLLSASRPPRRKPRKQHPENPQ